VNQGNRKLSQIFACSAINIAFDVQCLDLRALSAFLSAA
jgi:hypothetical protein